MFISDSLVLDGEKAAIGVSALPSLALFNDLNQEVVFLF